jgi:hypothetical protein
MTGVTDKHNQLINENTELRKRSDNLDSEFLKFKKSS